MGSGSVSRLPFRGGEIATGRQCSASLGNSEFLKCSFNASKPSSQKTQFLFDIHGLKRHKETEEQSLPLSMGLKRPWKAEEDEVLIKQVNKYGPVGLELHSIRTPPAAYRQVMLPPLDQQAQALISKTEKDRFVMQPLAQFGNKWARIAAHLPEWTDDNIMNFWSSRQKRLARILLASSSKQHEHKREVPPVLHHNVLLWRCPNHALRQRKGRPQGLAPARCRASLILHHCPTCRTLVRPILVAIWLCTSSTPTSSEPHIQIPFPHTPLPQLSILFLPKSHELTVRLDDLNYFSLLALEDDAFELADKEGFPPDMPLLWGEEH
ncbi:hypothetical protein NL676_009479 [Syzygium grande]|nr:hypothetical protein NL676_009479 [Syzygium grande]